MNVKLWNKFKIVAFLPIECCEYIAIKTNDVPDWSSRTWFWFRRSTSNYFCIGSQISGQSQTTTCPSSALIIKFSTYYR
jgi:hypothetical protein